MDTPDLNSLPDRDYEVTTAVVREAFDTLGKLIPLLRVEDIAERNKAMIAGDVAPGTRQNKIFRVSVILPEEKSERDQLIADLVRYSSGDVVSALNLNHIASNQRTVDIFVKLAWAAGEAENKATGYDIVAKAKGRDAIPVCFFPPKGTYFTEVPESPETHKLVITIFEEDFRTYNNMPDLFEEENSPWERLLPEVADLHSKLVAHGDLQMRNFGEIRGKFTIIDTSYVADLSNRSRVLNTLNIPSTILATNALELVFKFKNTMFYERFFYPAPADPYSAAVSAAIAKDLSRIYDSGAVVNYAALTETDAELIEFKRRLKADLNLHYFSNLSSDKADIQVDKIRDLIFDYIDLNLIRSTNPR